MTTTAQRAYIIVIEELISDCLGTHDKERDFSGKPSSLGKTFLGIQDLDIPCFVNSDQEEMQF